MIVFLKTRCKSDILDILRNVSSSSYLSNDIIRKDSLSNEFVNLLNQSVMGERCSYSNEDQNIIPLYSTPGYRSASSGQLLNQREVFPMSILPAIDG